MGPQRTSLHGYALRKGASFQEWHGWELPSSYSSVQAEYLAAMEGAAVHDSSYTGRIGATGQDVLDLLNRLSTNDVLSLEPSQAAATVLTDERGRILDLITVLNLGDHVLLLTSPPARERVMEWIDKYTIVDDVALEDITPTTSMYSVLGPGAGPLLGALEPVEMGHLEPYQSVKVTVAGVDCHVLRRDLGDLLRLEIIVQGKEAEGVWDAIVAAGAVPIGLEAYELLRVERGAPEHGRELGDSYNPLEAGLWGAISFTKGCYIGQEVVARLDTYHKVQKHLVYLSFSPEAGVEAGLGLARDGKEVGHITSMARLPTTGEVVGLGYVRKEAADDGTRLSLVGVDGAWAKVESPVLPFGPGDRS